MGQPDLPDLAGLRELSQAKQAALTPLLSHVDGTAPSAACMDRDLQQALTAPRFFGHATASHVLYVSTNPQCPPCRRDWPALYALITRLNPAEVQVHISGFGFSDLGTRLMFAAAVLATQSPEAGLAFLQAVFSAGAVPYMEGPAWIDRQIKMLPLPPAFDPRPLADPQLAQVWIDATRASVARFHLAYTPSYVFDNRVLPGLPSLADIRLMLLADGSGK